MLFDYKIFYIYLCNHTYHISHVLLYNLHNFLQFLIFLEVEEVFQIHPIFYGLELPMEVSVLLLVFVLELLFELVSKHYVLLLFFLVVEQI